MELRTRNLATSSAHAACSSAGATSTRQRLSGGGNAALKVAAAKRGGGAGQKSLAGNKGGGGGGDDDDLVDSESEESSNKKNLVDSDDDDFDSDDDDDSDSDDDDSDSDDDNDSDDDDSDSDDDNDSDDDDNDSDDDDNDSEADSDSEYETGSEEEVKKLGFAELLQQLYPSKYINEKVSALKSKSESSARKRGRGEERINIVFSINDVAAAAPSDDGVQAEEKTTKRRRRGGRCEQMSEYREQLDALKKLFPDSDITSDFERVYKAKLDREERRKAKKEAETRQDNLRKFKKLLRAPSNQLSDSRYFKSQLSVDEQSGIIQRLAELNEEATLVKVPYRIAVIQSSIPNEHKNVALKKIDMLYYMDPGDSEYFKLRNWVQTFMQIPFGLYKTLPVVYDVSNPTNKESCDSFMSGAWSTLNKAVYGLDDAKMQIMQMLGQLVVNPSSIGTSIAIQGPPGTGKTSLVKEGISRILNRPFSFIALGGATDSSFLEGHSYTYEGSTWGKIVQILVNSKCMNPVFYFDELDKVSDTAKGEEIVGILTHLTDTTQNSCFHDKYFSELDFDLSKCLFIFSYNDESKINPILKDRMYRIRTKGYELKQKIVIARNYLLPVIYEQVKFEVCEVEVKDEVLGYIIENFCLKEEGVRNLKRCLEIIFTKLNLLRLMDTRGEMLAQNKEMQGVWSEFVDKAVSKSMVEKLLKRAEEENVSYKAMYL